MKTTKIVAKWCATALIIIGGVAACTNEDMDNNAGKPEANGTMTLTASVEQPADTRLEYEDEGSGPIQTYWQSTDKIVVWAGINSYQIYANSLEVDQTATETDFTGYNPGAGDISIIYPAITTHVASINDYILTSAGQVQNGNANTDHLSAYDYMFGEDVAIEQVDGSTYKGEAKFKRQMAMIKFKLDIPDYNIDENGAISKISLSSTDMLFTTSKTFTNTPEPDAYGMSLEFADMDDYEDTSTPLTAYMMMLPANLSGKTVNIEVETAIGHRFTVSKPVTKAFQAGRYYTITISDEWILSGNTRITFSNDLEAAESFSGPFDGTSEYTPYYITDEYELKKLVDDVAGGEPYADTYFKLDGDIEITADMWPCIGSGNAITTRAGSTHFAGHFDGNNHSITGQLNLKEVGSNNYNKGFFGYVNGGSIKNLHNKATVTVTNCMQVGSIVGTIENGTISNCTNISDISSAGTYLAGIVGIAKYSDIINCKNSGAIISTNTNVGGIVAQAVGTLQVSTMVNCENNGAVTGKGYVGGIAGETTAITVVNAKNTGNITGGDNGQNTFTGGIVGKCGDAVSNSTNSGEIKTTGTGRPTGGICGYTTANITACTNSGKITGALYTGGIVGHNYGGWLHYNKNQSATITGGTSTGTIVGNQQSGRFYSCNTSVTVGTLEMIGSGSTTVDTCNNSSHK